VKLVERALGLDRPLLVALDVDGTIAPIVRDPDAAAVPKATLDALAVLAAGPDTQVALITGRDLASLRRMIGLRDVWLGVEHGGLVLGPGEAEPIRELSEERSRALRAFHDWTRKHAEDAFIERKPKAIAVHVRAIAETQPDRATALLQEAERVAESLALHVRKGRCVREAEAELHDKGNALREIVDRSGARSVLFAGDDVTDLPAIELASRNGMGVFVKSREPPASLPGSALVLDDVNAMAELLVDLAERLGSRVP